MAEDVPPETRKRRDIDTRATVDAVTRIVREEFQKEFKPISERLTKLEARQENSITMKQTLGASVALLCLAGGMGVFFLSRAEAAAMDAGVAAEKKADQALSRQADLERFVKQDLRELKAELKSDMADIKAEVRNTTKAVERTSPPRRRAPPADGGPNAPDPRGGP